jgi:hypothetical protein
VVEHQEDDRQRRCYKRHHNNQPANEMQKGERHQRTRGNGVLKAGGSLRQFKAEVAQQEDEKRRRCIMRMRGKGGGGGRATRGNATTSQDKLEVNGKQTPKGLADKRQRRRRRRRSVVLVVWGRRMRQKGKEVITVSPLIY